MAPTLLDGALEAQLDREGYVVVDAIDRARVDLLRQAYEALHPAVTSGFSTDFEQATPAVRREVRSTMHPIWQEVLPRFMTDHRAFLDTFLMKWPGDGSELAIHQDWTYVDESRFRSVSFWIALDDASADLDNGPLYVVPGSHRLARQVRGTHTLAWYEPFESYMMERGRPLAVEAGQAVIMDNRLLHFSPPNRSERPRLAIAAAVVPREAELVHGVDQGDGSVNILRVDEDFFLDTSPAALWANPPEGEVISVLPAIERRPDPSEVTARYQVPLDPEVASSGAAWVPGPLGPSEPPEPGGRPVDRLLGFALRGNYGLVLASSSSSGPVADRAGLTYLDDLEAHWSDIAAEYRAVREQVELAPMASLAGVELPTEGNWNGLILRDNRGWLAMNRARFPSTVAVLDRIEGLRAAVFSLLAPGARITPHRGVNNGVLRVHLGIDVPGPPGACALQVGATWVPWANGEAFAFDDTWEHAAFNRADGPRTVLMLEVDRPLGHGLARSANRAVQTMFRLHPQVRGAHRRIEAVDHALNA